MPPVRDVGLCTVIPGELADADWELTVYLTVIVVLPTLLLAPLELQLALLVPGLRAIVLLLFVLQAKVPPDGSAVAVHLSAVVVGGAVEPIDNPRWCS